jgi:beta-glucosidase
MARMTILEPSAEPPTPEVLWGVAMTASGSLGVSPRSDWGRWVDRGLLAPSSDGSGFGVDFRTDVELFADHGLRAVRWTIDWARLEPTSGRWDSDAVDLVTEVLRAARSAGIAVWAVLDEGPLPGWFTDDQGGFGDEAGLRRTWPRHVDRVAEAFGDLVAAWVPVLDPYTRAAEGWLWGTRPPGRRDEHAFADALRTQHLASHEAARLLASGEPPVVACIDLAPVHAGVTSREPDEREVAGQRARRIEQLRWDVWIRALGDGVVSVPGHADLEVEGLVTAYDIVGFTFRGGLTVYADGSTGPYPLDAAVAADGWAPWPEELGVVVRRLHDALPHRPLALLSAGLVAGEDDWRTEVIARTALEVERAVADRVPLVAAFWQSGIDGWTPEAGLTVPDGVIDRARHPRPSAAVLAAAAERRGALGG